MENTDSHAISVYGSKSLCESPDFPFIARPHLTLPLLQTAAKLPDLAATHFLRELIDLLLKSSLNIASLPRSKNQNGVDVLSFVVETVLGLLHGVRAGEVARSVQETWLHLLQVLLLYWAPSRNHYEAVYDKLGRVMEGCCMAGDAARNYEEIRLAAEVVEKMATVPLVSKNEPMAYFWFLPHSACLSAAIPKNTLWPFNRGFTILMWIKVASISLESNAFPVLFRMRNSANGFECFIANRCMNYRVISSSYSRPSNQHVTLDSKSNGISIGKLQPDAWQFCAVSHNPDEKLFKLQTLVAGEGKRHMVDYPKFYKGTEYLELVLFEDVVGAVGSVLVSEAAMSAEEIAAFGAAFPKGICDAKSVEDLSRIRIDKRITGWTAVSATEKVASNLSDEGVPGMLMGNSGTHAMARESKYLDPIQNILPFFHIVSLLDAPLATQFLNRTLKLSHIYLKALQLEYGNSISSLRLKKEAKHLVRTFGYHLLHYDPAIPDGDTIKYIGDIMAVSPGLHRRLLKMLMRTMNFWVNTEPAVLQLFWEPIKTNLISDENNFALCNVRVMVEVMEAMSSSLQGSPCCSKHADEPVDRSLGARYESMIHFVKFLIRNEPGAIVQNVNKIVSALDNRPCPCLFLSLLTVLKETAEKDVECMAVLCKPEALTTIFKAARGYLVEVKVACISLAAVCLNQREMKADIEEYKSSLIALINGSLRRDSIKFGRVFDIPNKDQFKRPNSLASSMSYKFSELVAAGKLTERPGQNAMAEEPEQKVVRKRTSSFSLIGGEQIVQKGRESVVFMEAEESLPASRIRSATEDQFNFVEEAKGRYDLESNKQFASKRSGENTPEVAHNPFSSTDLLKTGADEPVYSNISTLYTSLLLWLVGSKPDQSLSLKSNKPFTLEDKPVMKNIEAFPVVLALLKASNNEMLTRRCLDDFITLAKSNTSNRLCMMGSEEFSEWLIRAETQWYQAAAGKLLGADKLGKAFELHVAVLTEALNSQNGAKQLAGYFVFWVCGVYPASAVGKGSVRRSRESEESLWGCLKYVWMEVVRRSVSLQQIALFVEMTVNLVIIRYLVKAKGVRISDSNTGAAYRVTGQELIGGALDSLLRFCSLDNEFLSSFEFEAMCKENKLETSMQLLSTKSYKGVQLISKEQGYTNFAIILLSIGITNTDPNNAAEWLARAKKLAQHIGLLIEYASVKGYTRVVKNESKNLLLLLGILLYHYSVNKKQVKEYSKTLCDILLFIFLAAEQLNGQMKEFIRKVLRADESVAQEIFADVKKCVNAKDNLFNAKQLFALKATFLKEYERVSYASLEILKADFKKVREAILKKRREPKKMQSNKFKLKELKTYLPTLLNRQSSTREIPSFQPSKDDSVARILKDQVKVAEWTRKWAKTQKLLKQWQGGWRDKKVFDGGAVNVPLKLSKHTFGNGARCLMKLRSRRTECLPSEEFPESKDEQLNKESTFRLLAEITMEKGKQFDFTTNTKGKHFFWASDYSLVEYADLDTAQVLHSEVPYPIRKQLTEPLACEIYTPLYAVKGKILLYWRKGEKGYYVKFVLGREEMSGEDPRLMFTFEYRNSMKLVKKWKVRDIRVVYKKHIVEQRSALEIALVTGKSVLFNFSSEGDRDKFCSKLLGIKGTRIECFPKSGRGVPKDLTQDWVSWRLSTFDYLTALNNLSSRSFNNVSQYPVFPWVIDDMCSSTFELSNEAAYRCLGENVGMLGDKTRAQGFKDRYGMEDVTGMGKFHFGTHYSNPGIVFQMMMRVSPFIEAYIKFFSGLDHADRMFHSMEESQRSAKTDPNDVRELTPEFFSVPDVFVNREQLSFGRREDTKEEVDDVVLPPWAKANPYRFIEIQRRALESDCASKSMNKWIDLIFGYQQQGREAEKAHNIFPKLSYDAESILTKASESQRESYKMQAYHWGQTPAQLLVARHKERIAKEPNLSYSILDRKVQVKYTGKGFNEKVLANEAAGRRKVVKIFASEEPHKDPSFAIVTLGGTYIDYSIEVNESEYSALSQTKILSPQLVRSSVKSYKPLYCENGIATLSPLITSHFPIVLVRKHSPPYLVQGGYINGTLLFTQLAGTPKSVAIKAHREAITCLEINKEETIGVSGSVSGEIILYDILKEMTWQGKYCAHNHRGPVTHISISSEMQLFCTAGRDGTVNLHTFAGGLLRKFAHPVNAPVDFALLSHSPVGCVVVYAKETGTVYSFSMSGELMCKEEESTREIVDAVIGRDSNFNEYLVYLNGRDNILSALRLPDLTEKISIVKKKGTAIAFFDNQRMGVIGDEIGEFTLIWNPYSINSQNKPLLILY